MKVCNKCGETLPLDMFGKNNQRKDGLNSSCKKCRREYENAKYARVAKCRLVKKYGITHAQREELFKLQGGRCKICGVHERDTRRALSVDHCHKTLQVRGLLCDSCNRGLGFLQDDPELLRNALRYLGG